MDSSKDLFIKRKKSPNKLRTKLLLLANDEIIRIKKTNYTQINSKNLSEFEKFYADLNNNNAIELKEEKFVSRGLTDIIQQNIIKEKFTLKSPDGNSLMNFIGKENSLETIFLKKENNRDFKNFGDKRVLFLENLGIESKKSSDKLKDPKQFLLNKKKSVISSKKNLFFKMNTIRKHTNTNSESANENNVVIKTRKNIDYDKNIQLINFDDDKFLNLPQTKKRYEEGFNYLRKLAKRLKIIKKKGENYCIEVALDEISQTIKEKTETKNSLNKTESSTSSSALNKKKDRKRNSNQSNKSENLTNYILKINDEIVRGKNVKESFCKNQTAKMNNNSVSDKQDIINCNPISARKNYKNKGYQEKENKANNDKFDHEENYFTINFKDLNAQRRKSTYIYPNNLLEQSKHLLSVKYLNGTTKKNTNSSTNNLKKDNKHNNNKNTNKFPDCKSKESPKNFQNEFLDKSNERRNSKTNMFFNLNQTYINPNSSKNSKFGSKNTTPRDFNEERKQITPKRIDSNSSKFSKFSKFRNSSLDSEDNSKEKTERQFKSPNKKDSNLSKLSSISLKKRPSDCDLFNNNNKESDKNQKKNKIPMNKIDFSKIYKRNLSENSEDQNKGSCKKIFYLNSSNSLSNSNEHDVENENSYDSNEKDINPNFNQIIKLKSPSNDSSDSEPNSEYNSENEKFSSNEQFKDKNKPISHREKYCNNLKNELESYRNYKNNDGRLNDSFTFNSKNNYCMKNTSKKENKNRPSPERIYTTYGISLDKSVGEKINISDDYKTKKNKINISEKDKSFQPIPVNKGFRAYTLKETLNQNDTYKKTFFDFIEIKNNNLNGSILNSLEKKSLMCKDKEDLPEKSGEKSKDLKTFSNRKSYNNKDTLLVENKSNSSNYNFESSNNKKQENRKISDDSFSQFNSIETTYNSSGYVKKGTNSPSSAKAENEALGEKNGFSIKLLECDYKHTDESSNEKDKLSKHKVNNRGDVKKDFFM